MVIPSYKLISPAANSSFIFKWDHFDLTTRWHYHPEVELIFFVEGNTSAVIGDVFKEFKKGDLVILGANFPHVLQQSKQFTIKHPDVKPFGLIIQFKEDFLGSEFINKTEMLSLKKMLHKTQRGLLFHKNIIDSVKPTLLNMNEQNDSRRLLNLLDVLISLADSEDYDYLTPQEYFYDFNYDEDRLKKIHQFVYDHFSEKISVAKVASLANMTEVSFCRYFKSRTLKTFTCFLNEVRIAYACKLLHEKDTTVTNACFESGFGSLSYFNRRFKKIVKMSPYQYQCWKKEVVA